MRVGIATDHGGFALKEELVTRIRAAGTRSSRLTRIFLRDANGRRPVFGGIEKFQTDPHWRDHILFHEYFHGDNGAGIGASHQTGWSGLVAMLIEVFRSLDPEQVLGAGRTSLSTR